MDSIRFMPINFRLEAAAALSRLAYRGDELRAGDMRASADYYSRKYGVPIEVFDGLVETFEFVKARARIEESELIALFGLKGVAFPEVRFSDEVFGTDVRRKNRRTDDKPAQ